VEKENDRVKNKRKEIKTEKKVRYWKFMAAEVKSFVGPCTG
jgi:hypothetical protein